jgi:ATP-dependent DNA ligase
MAQFTVTQEASIQGSDLWQGEVEYQGEKLQYRYYGGYDGQEVYVLTEQGWEMGTELGDVIFAACQEWGGVEDFGPVGEVCEIDDDTVEDYK